ncbi:TPA: hypothetical protein ACH3X2_003461 [Trebouxia sp. C0005]
MSGRGRGRGRGRGPILPKVTDDEGNVVPPSEFGPPPLFPNVELPPMLEIEAQDQRLMERWRGLNQYYIKSPYHLRGPPKGKDPSAGQDAKRLAMVMTLDPRYFPEELYTSKERKVSSRAASASAQQAYWAAEASKISNDNPMLDRLARLETEYGKSTPEKGEEGGQKKKAEDGEAEEDEPIEEDEDDFQDDDDYYQGNVFDDDEGYDDALDDGDDGAIY